MTTVSGNAAADQDRKAPGRPRDARADSAILDAVISLLSGGLGVDSLSIEAVAAKAGVGKATIYRRWPNKEALLIDAVVAMKGPPATPDGESVREDLLMLVRGMRGRRTTSHGRATLCLLPELLRNPDMQHIYQEAIVEPRREVMRQVLLRGIRTGELRADLNVEMTLLMISGTAFLQNMLTWNPAVPDEGFAEALVDTLLAGATPR